MVRRSLFTGTVTRELLDLKVYFLVKTLTEISATEV